MVQLVHPCILGCLLCPSPRADPRWHTGPRYGVGRSRARSPFPKTPRKQKQSREAAARQPGSFRHTHGGGSGSALDLVLPNRRRSPACGSGSPVQPMTGVAGERLCPGSGPS